MFDTIPCTVTSDSGQTFQAGFLGFGLSGGNSVALVRAGTQFLAIALKDIRVGEAPAAQPPQSPPPTTPPPPDAQDEPLPRDILLNTAEVSALVSQAEPRDLFFVVPLGAQPEHPILRQGAVNGLAEFALSIRGLYAWLSERLLKLAALSAKE